MPITNKNSIRRDVFIRTTEETVYVQKNGSWNEKKRGISLFVPVNPEANKYAHARVAEAVRPPADPKTCLITRFSEPIFPSSSLPPSQPPPPSQSVQISSSNFPSGIPRGTALLWDFNIPETPSSDTPVAHHVTWYPAEQYNFNSFDRFAQCKDVAWLPCPFHGHGEDLDRPDVMDPHTDCASQLMEYLLQRPDEYSEETRYEAALYQYFFGHWKSASLEALKSIMGDCLANLIIMAEKHLPSASDLGFEKFVFEPVIACAHKFLQNEGSVNMHLSTNQLNVENMSESFSALSLAPQNSIFLTADVTINIFVRLMTNIYISFLLNCGYQVNRLDVLPVESFFISIETSPPLSRMDLENLKCLSIPGLQYEIDACSFGEYATPDICSPEEGSDKDAQQFQDFHVRLACKSGSGKEFSATLPNVPTRLSSVAVQCKGMAYKGTSKERRCKNKTLKFSGFCHLHVDQQ